MTAGHKATSIAADPITAFALLCQAFFTNPYDAQKRGMLARLADSFWEWV
jgi:hypothetical protein